MELSTIERELRDLPLWWSRSAFGPATIHVQGKGPWKRLNVYVYERDFEEFASEVQLLMNALPVWDALLKWCTAERGAWMSGYLSVRQKILPKEGVYLPLRLFDPDHYATGKEAAELLACKEGMRAFLKQMGAAEETLALEVA